MAVTTRALVGREPEVRLLASLVEEVRNGQSRVLIVRGDPGIGKTALVNHAMEAASDVRLLRAVGVESEKELPFAALHQLCAPVLGRLDALPGPQQEALRKVFGFTGGETPDRFLVGLGVLSLLSGLGAEQPLVCLIDDAHWLDQASAQTMAFVARRLLADPVAFVFVARWAPPVFAGFPDLLVGALGHDDAGVLLHAAIPFVVDAEVRARILAEASGNPLALLEFPRGLTAEQLTSGVALPRDVPVAARIEETFRRRLAGLPADTRSLMLVAAAEPVGDPTVVYRAAEVLGVEARAIDPAEASGLVEARGRFVFRHPLVRSAVYGAATSSERREAHRALAAATDPAFDPDRRAWHLASATIGTDDGVAEELERSADRAQARGGYAASAAFLERAAALTSDPATRALRTLAAASSMHLSGAHGTAGNLLTQAELGPLDETWRAQADRLRAEIAYVQRRGSDAPLLLLRAAARLERLDARAAGETYADAMIAAHFVGRLADGTTLRELAQAARRGWRPADPPSVIDLEIDGFTTALLDGYAAGAPVLQQAVRAICDPRVPTAEALRWSWPLAWTAMALWDDEAYDVLSARHIQLIRASGFLAMLPMAMNNRIVACAFMGEFDVADQLLGEMEPVAEATDTTPPPFGSLAVIGWRGREAEAAEAIATAVREVTRRGEGGALTFADYAWTLIHNGHGRYREALTSATAIDAFETDGITIYPIVLGELIEAAVRSGARAQAEDAFERLAETTRVTRTDWGKGIWARSSALLSEDAAAEEFYQASIAHLGRTRIKPQLARSHLLYGEWLRRQNRRVDGREQLRTAYEMLSAMGVEAFAERARSELLATGETVRKRATDASVELTPQEANVARLAATGHTNPEIGAQLFISARTVEYHLGKVFTKLRITSRRQLRRALSSPGTPAARH